MRIVAVIATAFILWAGWASADSMSAGDWRSCSSRRADLRPNETCTDITGCFGQCDIYGNTWERELRVGDHVTYISAPSLNVDLQIQLDRIEAMLCELGHRTRGFSISACYATDPALCPPERPDPFEECKP